MHVQISEIIFGVSSLLTGRRSGRAASFIKVTYLYREGDRNAWERLRQTEGTLYRY